MEDSGILAQVPGQFVAEACEQLPDPATAEDRQYEVVIEVGHAGRVKIYYERHVGRRGKNSHWFWVGVRAERMG